MTETTKMSSKGQIVIPQNLRDELDLKEGETFAVIGNDDTILLKKISVPSEKEMFEKLNKWGTELAKKKSWKEEDVQNIIKKRRSLQ